MIDTPESQIAEDEQLLKPDVERIFARWKALPAEQQRLMRALHRFLMLTLTILVVAIVLLVFVDTLSARAWTAWILKGFVVMASVCLGIGPAYVLREAARSVSTLVALVLLLLASPALAETTHCTTYEGKTLSSLHTVCADGTQAVSTYNRVLGSWETTITTPGKPCTGQMNPRTNQVEVRCR